VEETLVPGASVSRVARRHDVNANQVFRWRKLYSEGQLGTTANFLPVKIANEPALEAGKENHLLPRSGTMEIQLCKGTLRIFGSVDMLTLHAVIECLVG
jgi:transposase